MNEALGHTHHTSATGYWLLCGVLVYLELNGHTHTHTHTHTHMYRNICALTHSNFTSGVQVSDSAHSLSPRRGRPLKLHPESLQDLHDLWLSHGFVGKITKELEKKREFLAFPWNRL